MTNTQTRCGEMQCGKWVYRPSAPARARCGADRGLRNLRLLLAGGLAACLVVLAFNSGLAGFDAEVRSKPKPLAAFSLRDGDGGVFENSALEGRWSLVMLGFTQCPDVCPFTLQNIALIMEELATRVSPGRMPQVVFVGVDPDRDRAVIGEYVRHFGDRFIGVSGEWAEVKKVVETLEGFVRIKRKAGDAQDYQVFHSAIVSVVDPQGRLAAGIKPPMEPAPAAQFLAELFIKFDRLNKSN
jgi:protein SCO1/2